MQRLAIAQALYQKPHLIFLDEATSALDANTESQILEYLYSIPRLTIVAISHKMLTMQLSDYTLSFDRDFHLLRY